MFDKAMVALDLSAVEGAILDCLPALQAWGIRELVLVHVVQVGYGQGATAGNAELLEDWLEQHARGLREAGFAVTTQLRASGDLAAGILASATETGARLLVAGSRGQNLSSALFLGSVARELVRTSPLPLLLEWIEPTAAATGRGWAAVCREPLRHVLFATDFSERAANAGQVVQALASQAGQLSCVHVAGGPAEFARARAAMDRLAGGLATAQDMATGEVLDGRPASAIAAYAERINASLIVMGKRGQNRLASLLVGSTTTGVCEIAGRPVLVIP